MPRQRRKLPEIILFADVLHPQREKLISDYKKERDNAPPKLNVWLTQPEFDLLAMVIHDRVQRCREVVSAVRECNERGVIPPVTLQGEYLFALQCLDDLKELDEKFHKHRSTVVPNPAKQWK